MGFDEGSIILDSETGQYFTGQTIHGKLVFDQAKVKTFRGLYVKIKGVCKVHWTTTSSRDENGRSVSYDESYDSNEEYFSEKRYLLGSGTGEYTLQPGHYELTFQFDIPSNCPSSFEGSNGYVRYEIKAAVDRAFKLDQTKKSEIKVIAPIDLNIDPYCKEPLVMTFEDTYCCCCMAAGFINTVVKVPVSGFCPGQRIPIEVSSKNQSTVRINLIHFYLKQEITFQAVMSRGTKTEESTIAEFKMGPVPPNSKREFNCDLEIPIIDVYNLDSCKFIDIEYSLQVVVKPEGCYSNSEGSRRIVMGMIPLLGFQDHISNPILELTAESNKSGKQFPTNNIGFTVPSNPPYPTPALQYPINPGNSLPNREFTTQNPAYPVPGYPGSAQPIPQNPPYPLPNQPPMGNRNYDAPYPKGDPPTNGVQEGSPNASQYPSSNPAVANTMHPPHFGFTVGDPKKDSTMPIFVQPSAPEPFALDSGGDKPLL